MQLSEYLQLNGKTLQVWEVQDNFDIISLPFILGKGGKMLNVTSNYLRIEEKPNTGVYEYEVRFSPNVDMRNERFRLIRQIEPIIGTVRVSMIARVIYKRVMTRKP